MNQFVRKINNNLNKNGLPGVELPLHMYLLMLYFLMFKPIHALFLFNHLHIYSCLWIFHLLEMKIRYNFAVISMRFLHFCYLLCIKNFTMSDSLNKLLITTTVFQNDYHQSFVVSLNDCSEFLLHCCIPNPTPIPYYFPILNIGSILFL